MKMAAVRKFALLLPGMARLPMARCVRQEQVVREQIVQVPIESHKPG